MLYLVEPVKLAAVGNDVIMLEQNDVIFSIEIHCQASVKDRRTTGKGNLQYVETFLKFVKHVKVHFQGLLSFTINTSFVIFFHLKKNV